MKRDAQPVRTAWQRSRVGALALLLIAAVLSPLASPSGAGAADAVALERIWGTDRYETSLAIVQRFIAEAGGRIETAVVVPGTDWREAVIAAGLAGSLNAPVLLSPSSGLGTAAVDVLETAGVSQVVVIDGAGTLNATALEGLRRRFDSVELLSSSDPSELSAMAAQRAGSAGRLNRLGRTAVLASAEVFVDAMVAGPIAWRGQHPVLLTPPGTLDGNVAAAAAELDVEHVVVMGGVSAVSQQVVDGLIAAKISFTRIGGATRFDTARVLAGFIEGAYASGSGGRCFDRRAAGVATARSPYDALSAAPLLGRRCSPLLLSDVSAADPSTVAWVRSHTRSLTVFGGTAAVSDAAARVLRTQAPVYETVATGAEHACAIAVGGAIVCWGDDSHGQLDAPDGAFTAIAAAGHHSCALKATGRAACWGGDASGQLDVPGDEFIAIAAGGVPGPGSAATGFSCGLRRADGSVSCWGDDAFGQVSQAPSGRFTAVVAGWGHACALRASDGGVLCWGLDGRGQVSQAPSGRLASIAAGAWHSCALRRPSGEVVCWGTSEAAEAAPSGRFTAVAAGADVTCALRRDDGKAVCWGFDGLGQVSGAPSGAFRSIVSSAWHVCAVRDTGEIACWGDDSEGQATPPLV